MSRQDFPDPSKYQGRVERSVKHNLTKPLGVARWFAKRCEEVSMEAGKPRVKDVNQQRMAKQLRTDMGAVPLEDIVAAMELFLEDESWLDSPYPAWSQFYRQSRTLLEDVKSVRLAEPSQWDDLAEEHNRR
jgi:hypothetical protein